MLISINFTEDCGLWILRGLYSAFDNAECQAKQPFFKNLLNFKLKFSVKMHVFTPRNVCKNSTWHHQYLPCCNRQQSVADMWPAKQMVKIKTVFFMKWWQWRGRVDLQLPTRLGITLASSIFVKNSVGENVCSFWR